MNCVSEKCKCAQKLPPLFDDDANGERWTDSRDFLSLSQHDKIIGAWQNMFNALTPTAAQSPATTMHI